jgi:hypothetical protein
VGAAVLTLFAFSVRSNGAFLGAAFLLSIGCVWYSEASARRTVVSSAGVFGMTLLIGLVSYFGVFPDGSLTHVGYLTWEIGSVLARARATVASALEFAPYSLFYGQSAVSVAVTVILLACFAASVAIGIWNTSKHSLLLVSYALLNLGLLLLFPFSQGPRYLYPVLLPAVVLGLVGLRVVYDALPATLCGRWKDSITAHKSFYGAAAVVVSMAYLGFTDVRTRRAEAVSGPYSVAMNNVVGFLVLNVPLDARISFFKPRAMRLLTGRDAIKVGEPSHAWRADYFVLDKRPDDGRWEDRWQLGRSFFEHDHVFGFNRVYENEQFVVYRRVETSQNQVATKRPAPRPAAVRQRSLAIRSLANSTP